MSDFTGTSTGVNQSGKSGGDTYGLGLAGSSAGAVGVGAGTGLGYGDVSGGTGVGVGAAGAGASSAGQAGGDVSDNTSIGSITINS